MLPLFNMAHTCLYEKFENIVTLAKKKVLIFISSSIRIGFIKTEEVVIQEQEGKRGKNKLFCITTIIFVDGGQFLVVKHCPTKQQKRRMKVTR